METEGRRRRPKRYTAAEKARVVGDVAELGIRGAGRRHGVPESTIRRWLKKGKKGKAEGSGRTGVGIAG